MAINKIIKSKDGRFSSDESHTVPRSLSKYLLQIFQQALLKKRLLCGPFSIARVNKMWITPLVLNGLQSTKFLYSLFKFSTCLVQGFICAQLRKRFLVLTFIVILIFQYFA